MSEAPARTWRVCPYCAAATRLGAKECWLCGALVEESWAKVGPTQFGDAFARRRTPLAAGSGSLGSAAPLETRGRFQFGLSTLMLIVTLFAIICSISVMAPGLGVVVGIVSLFGILGAVRRSHAAEARGVPFSQTQKVGAFFRSAGITFVVLTIIVLVIGLVLFLGLLIICSGWGI